MPIRIDLTKCEGIGICEMLAPGMFEVGDDNQAHVVTDAHDEGDLDMAHEALSNCPRAAISVVSA
ncbi:ferredoxin [Mycobacteroides salmoniphilum]|uniref:Ferredoxin n=1 Tax=Mycobacteroides salmoniphilum TaxID=404941 RepID=A0A4R8SD61_9MYCO|nr:ferredoxin [Mycobacteroides salmoniphilum]TDZ93229.1 Ferredoxin [Mycobacteroides salmoniphilum]TEA07820.1 Ferredoxin [Mycobacteroides salmoniphilum]